MKQKNVNETALFYAGWVLIALIVMLWFLFAVDPFRILERVGILSNLLHFPLLRQLSRLHQLPCLLNSITGLYCPGCGGTRAVLSLLRGNLFQSFVYHPFVIYGALLGGWFMLSQSIERFTHQKIKIGLKYKDIYLWMALAIVIINFIIKNVMLVSGTDLLKLF